MTADHSPAPPEAAASTAAPLSLSQARRRLTILRQLARGTSLGQTVAATGSTAPEVRAIATEFNWPNDLPSMTLAARALADQVTAMQLDATAAARDARATATTPGATGRPVVGRDREYRDVPVAALRTDPGQQREHLTDVDDLASSMATVGLVLPVVARHHDGGLVLVDGHRRHAAATQLGWPTIPCVIRRDVAPGDVSAAAFVANTQREGLDPIEQARALQRISRERKLGTAREIGLLIGRSASWVSDRLALLDLPDVEQDALRRGTVSIAAAVRSARQAAGTARTSPTSARPAARPPQASPTAPPAATTAPAGAACPTCGAVQVPAGIPRQGGAVEPAGRGAAS